MALYFLTCQLYSDQMSLLLENQQTDRLTSNRLHRARRPSRFNAFDIQKGYNLMGKPDANQLKSVDARQELDLNVGVTFSQFQTRFFHGR